MHHKAIQKEIKENEPASQQTAWWAHLQGDIHLEAPGSYKLPLHLHKYVIIEFIEDADRRETSEATSRVIII